MYIQQVTSLYFQLLRFGELVFVLFFFLRSFTFNFLSHWSKVTFFKYMIVFKTVERRVCYQVLSFTFGRLEHQITHTDEYWVTHCILSRKYLHILPHQ